MAAAGTPAVWTRAKNPARQCTAHRKNGDRCRKFPIMAGNVCATHGGKARQVREKAQPRLAEAADKMAARVIGFALHNDVPENIALAAAKNVLDRIGISAKTAVEIGVSLKPCESILGEIAGIESG